MTLNKQTSSRPSPDKRVFRSIKSAPDLMSIIHPSVLRSVTGSPIASPSRGKTAIGGKWSKLRRVKKCQSQRKNSCSTDDSTDQWMHFRRRVNTLPVEPAENMGSGCYRLRSFSVTSRGILNLGDHYRYRSGSDTSVASPCSSSSNECRDRTSSCSSSYNSDCKKLRVLVLGSENVGKTSLVAQFKTSEYLIGNDECSRNVTDDAQDRNVSVLLDGEEFELAFEEITRLDKSVDETELTSTDAVLLMYSVTDRDSFNDACALLSQLRVKPSHSRAQLIGSKAVIMVGNKSDLVRCRTVSTEESRLYAEKYDSKCIETSVTISHNVDELLVGIVSQIRLKSRQSESARQNVLTLKARGLMYKLLQKCELKTRSCDNLHVI